MFIIDHYSVALLKCCMFCTQQARKALDVDRRTPDNFICKTIYWNRYKMWSRMHDMYWSEYYDKFSFSKNKEI